MLDLASRADDISRLLTDAGPGVERPQPRVADRPRSPRSGRTITRAPGSSPIGPADVVFTRQHRFTNRHIDRR